MQLFKRTALALTQHIPYSNRAERTLKPIIYEVISDSN